MSRQSSTIFMTIITAVLLVSGCSRKTIEWREQVQLSDGRVIEIETVQSFQTFSELGGLSSAFPTQIKLQIVNPPVATPWVDRMLPIFLDVDPTTQDYILVTTTRDERVLKERGKPRPQYWQFRLRGDAWVEEPVSTFLWGRKANLIFWAFDIDGFGDFIELEEKTEFYTRQASASRTLREIWRDASWGD
jgi:hypothetical protein